MMNVDRAGLTARALIAESRLTTRDAELLLLGLLGKDRAWLYSRGDEPLALSVQQDYQRYVERRRAGEPIAYILGQREFWSMSLRVAPGVLIPRPDTELLVEWALELLDIDDSQDPVAQTDSRGISQCRHSCLDLGTGSGAIALALKKERPNLRVTAVDASDDALAIAQDNGRRLGLAVEWLKSDWFETLAGRRWPLIVSNPPYIAAEDPHLSEGDLPSEPASALVSGIDGLDAIRQIVADSTRQLLPGGWLCLEHGWDQAAVVRALLESAGFVSVQSRRDLAGHERVSGGQFPNSQTVQGVSNG